MEVTPRNETGNGADQLWDDPERDFRQRYELPEHFVWDRHDLPMIDYLGYVAESLKLLPDPPASVIDVGCGDGWIARELLDHGYEVTGLDYSDRAIRFARILAPGARFHELDIRRLADRSEFHSGFDTAVCIEVLEHVPPEHQPDVLRGIRECLKPGGSVVVTVPSVHLPLNPWHYKHFTVEEISGLLEENGFRVEDVVNQRVLTFLFSDWFWRLLRNRIYDLRIARVLLGELLLKRFNVTSDPERAGRYVVRAEPA